MIILGIFIFILMPVLTRLAFEFGRRSGKSSLRTARLTAFNKGRDAGFAQGELSGYKKGFADGEKSGYKKGKDEGFADGHRYGAAQNYNEKELLAMGLQFSKENFPNKKH